MSITAWQHLADSATLVHLAGNFEEYSLSWDEFMVTKVYLQRWGKSFVISSSDGKESIEAGRAHAAWGGCQRTLASVTALKEKRTR